MVPVPIETARAAVAAAPADVPSELPIATVFAADPRAPLKVPDALPSTTEEIPPAVAPSPPAVPEALPIAIALIAVLGVVALFAPIEIERIPKATAPGKVPSDPPMAIVVWLKALVARWVPCALPMASVDRSATTGPVPPTVPDALPIRMHASNADRGLTPIAIARPPSAIAPAKTPSAPPIAILPPTKSPATAPANVPFALPIAIPLSTFARGPLPPAVPEALPSVMVEGPVEIALSPTAILRLPIDEAPPKAAPSAPPSATEESPVALAPALAACALPIAMALVAVAVGAKPVLVESRLPMAMVRAAVAFAASPMATLSVAVAVAVLPRATVKLPVVKVLFADDPILILSVPDTPAFTAPLPANKFLVPIS